MSFQKLILLLLFILFSVSAQAATLMSDGSASDTQSKITSAATGDTVLLPSSGSFTWASTVTLPDTKAITLDGNGRTVTLNGGDIELNPHAAGNTRLTGFTFIVTGDNAINLNDTATSAAYRFDHCTISPNNGNLFSIINIQARGAGLMDHVTVTNINSVREFIHITGWGAENTTGWTTAVSQGSASLNYIEDCDFHGLSSNGNSCWLEGFYGCRIVIRHNTFDYVSVDMHGTHGAVGARWWECYENTFATGSNQSWAFSFRAGSGVIFNNSKVSGSRPADIGLCEEDSGYPADYQIGRGINQTSDPAYIWNNTSISVAENECDAPEQPGMVQLDRDYFLSVKSGYSSFTYPHPLNDSGGGSTGGGTGGSTAPVVVSGRVTISGRVTLQ